MQAQRLGFTRIPDPCLRIACSISHVQKLHNTARKRDTNCPQTKKAWRKIKKSLPRRAKEGWRGGGGLSSASHVWGVATADFKDWKKWAWGSLLPVTGAEKLNKKSPLKIIHKIKFYESAVCSVCKSTNNTTHGDINKAITAPKMLVW